ncbi:hypothetical protein ACVW17_003709 [Bradyrhizobium sp. USDA 4473]
MPIARKPLEIPPEVARKFAAKMQAFHAERDPLKRDEIAADTRHILLQHMPKGAKLSPPSFVNQLTCGPP